MWGVVVAVLFCSEAAHVWEHRWLAACVGFFSGFVLVLSSTLWCYTEKASNAWHRRGTKKDRKHLQSTQSAHSTHVTDQAPSTTERTAQETHQWPRQPCMPQHNNNPPSSPTSDRVITISFQPTRHAAKPRSNTGGLAEQAGGAAQHHRHHPPQRGHGAPPAC